MAWITERGEHAADGAVPVDAAGIPAIRCEGPVGVVRRGAGFFPAGALGEDLRGDAAGGAAVAGLVASEADRQAGHFAEPSVFHAFAGLGPGDGVVPVQPGDR